MVIHYGFEHTRFHISIRNPHPSHYPPSHSLFLFYFGALFSPLLYDSPSNSADASIQPLGQPGTEVSSNLI